MVKWPRKQIASTYFYWKRINDCPFSLRAVHTLTYLIKIPDGHRMTETCVFPPAIMQHCSAASTISQFGPIGPHFAKMWANRSKIWANERKKERERKRERDPGPETFALLLAQPDFTYGLPFRIRGVGWCHGVLYIAFLLLKSQELCYGAAWM